MYQLRVSDSFSAAHRLRGYRGRCEKLHGHNYRVEVRLEGEKLDSCGLLIDFGILKKKLRSVLRRFDHADLNRLAEFRRSNPSAENLARVIFQKMNRGIAGRAARVAGVTVWESDNSSACYFQT